MAFERGIVDAVVEGAACWVGGCVVGVFEEVAS
jgi:hypothetical protein